MHTLRRSLILLAVAAGSFVACSSGDGAGLGGATTASLPGKAALEQAALTVDDLPAGFAASPASSSSRSDLRADNTACQRALDAMANKGGDDVASVRFTRRRSDSIEQKIKLNADAARQFKEVTRVFREQCRSSTTFTVGGFRGSLASVGVGRIGDDAAAFRLTYTGVTRGVRVSATGYIIATRRGPVISSVGQLAVSAPSAGLSGSTPDLADVVSLAKRADAKIDAVVH